MKLTEIRKSGLLELYVIGDLSNDEQNIIESAILEFPELKQDLFEIEKSLEAYAFANEHEVEMSSKPMLLAGVNYYERLKAGEEKIVPPSLNRETKIVDFNNWIENKSFQEPDSYESIHVELLSSTDHISTAMIWLKEGAPPEIHTDEIEKFFILEGSCDIFIGDTKHSLIAGDFLEIPLHIIHNVVVTSEKRCKIIMERTAA